jgi:NitT/TauT family transport system permease protein
MTVHTHEQSGLVRAVVPPDEQPSILSTAFRKLRLWLLLLATVVAWELYTQFVDVPSYLLPRPEQIINEFIEKPDVVLNAFAITTIEAGLGFTVAAILGLILAILIARSALLEEFLYPYLNIIRVTPVIAIAPLLTIWFGHGITPMIIVSTLIAFFPIVVATALGLRSVDADLISLMRTLNASETHILRKIRLPNALPYLFAAFRISAPLAVIGALVGEFVGASAGLGYLLVTARGRIDTSMVFLMVALSAMLGIMAFAAVVAIERRFIRWHQSVQLE